MDAVVDAFVARAAAAFGDGRRRARTTSCTGARRRAPATPATRASARCCAACARPGWRPRTGSTSPQRKPDVAAGARCASARATAQLGATVHDLGLVTVCEEAGCPNIYECWADGTATFMINGERCTRACGFCQVDTRHPLPLSPDEPERVAEAVERMGLGHAVVTCVARDDLADGGAGAMAATIRAIRRAHARHDGRGADLGLPGRRGVARRDLRRAARRAQPQHRDGGPAPAGRAALGRLRPQPGRAGPGRRRPAWSTKSGLMVGLGEREDEVVATMADLRGVGVSIVTIGQYLRPEPRPPPGGPLLDARGVRRACARPGAALGLAHVEASPLTRSSYHAREAAARVGRRAEAPHALPGHTLVDRAEASAESLSYAVAGDLRRRAGITSGVIMAAASTATTSRRLAPSGAGARACRRCSSWAARRAGVRRHRGALGAGRPRLASAG